MRFSVIYTKHTLTSRIVYTATGSDDPTTACPSLDFYLSYCRTIKALLDRRLYDKPSIYIRENYIPALCYTGVLTAKEMLKYL